MSIKIHHGANGSYKTSGAVQDDVIPALLAGRTVITNIRGLSNRSLIQDVLKLKEKPNILNFDTSTSEGQEKFRKWFHWAPVGALIVIDEINEIYPKSWTATHFRALDYPGGTDAANKAKKPENFILAIDKHRHYNWDIIVTAPHIKKVRDEIKQCSDGAFKHINRANVGLKGSYVELMHAGDDSGNASSITDHHNKRIKKSTFSLYESTSTGVVQDTLNVRPIWKNPKILTLSIFTLAAFAYGGWGATQSENGKLLGKDPKRISSGVVMDQAKPSDKVRGAPRRVDSPVPGRNISANEGVITFGKLAGNEIYLVGSFSPHGLLFEVNGNIIHQDVLSAMDYEITYYSDCFASVDDFMITCKDEKETEIYSAESEDVETVEIQKKNQGVTVIGSNPRFERRRVSKSALWSSSDERI